MVIKVAGERECATVKGAARAGCRRSAAPTTGRQKRIKQTIRRSSPDAGQMVGSGSSSQSRVYEVIQPLRPILIEVLEYVVLLNRGVAISHG